MSTASVISTCDRASFLGRPLALVIALLLIAATLFAGNHCELGGMKKFTTQEHSCCMPAPSKGSAPIEYSQCCAPLEVPLPVVAQAPVAQFVEIGAAWTVADLPDPAAVDGEPVLISWANSPPGFSPLLELVLRRSAPAHAPPIFVA